MVCSWHNFFNTSFMQLLSTFAVCSYLQLHFFLHALFFRMVCFFIECLYNYQEGIYIANGLLHSQLKAGIHKIIVVVFLRGVTLGLLNLENVSIQTGLKVGIQFQLSVGPMQYNSIAFNSKIVLAEHLYNEQEIK